jgi:hypothetical protein
MCLSDQENAACKDIAAMMRQDAVCKLSRQMAIIRILSHDPYVHDVHFHNGFLNIAVYISLTYKVEIPILSRRKTSSYQVDCVVAGTSVPRVLKRRLIK